MKDQPVMSYRISEQPFSRAKTISTKRPGSELAAGMSLSWKLRHRVGDALKSAAFSSGRVQTQK